MFTERKCFESSEGNVWKYVFAQEGDRPAVAETVLYRYEDFMKRTVICCSTMSGCPVGCVFCGTGKKFVRNLKAEEIVQQIMEVLKDKGINNTMYVCEKFQIMLMSMGEPMLNWDEVEKAIRILNIQYPNAQLLISTIGVDNDEVFGRIISLSKEIDKLGLQFSIHKAFDQERNYLIPFENKMPLRKIRDAGIIWWKETGRKVFLNYCIDGENNTKQDANELKTLFSPMVFNMTFSVVCSADENMKDKGFKKLEEINGFSNGFLKDGYNTRVFDPAGQDDIGGGCGQLWYVQEWMKDHNR